MKLISRYLLSYLLALAPIFSLTIHPVYGTGSSAAAALDDEDTPSDTPPLGQAKNALRFNYAKTTPELQEGFTNDDDKWLLYAKEFDFLSGNMQSRLMRKYGLLFTAPKKSEEEEAIAHQQAVARAAAQAEAGPGDNVQANNPDLDLNERNQSETSIAAFGNNIVVAYNDSTVISSLSAISYSRDGGKTWRETIPPVFPFGAGFGDPVLAAAPDGSFYYAQIMANALGNQTLGVTKSTDGGKTWSAPVNPIPSLTNPNEFADKEWIVVDNSNSTTRGNVYVTYTRFSNVGTEGIYFVRSTNGGRTWSTPKLIGAPNDDNGGVQFSMPAIGPNGEVYVSYFDSRLPGMAVVKSTNGGDTFSTPVTVIRDNTIRESRLLAGGFDIAYTPSIAVDTSAGANRGTVYVTTQVKPTAPAARRDSSDVIIARSTNGGASWSAPLKISDDPFDCDQFMPSVAVAKDGTVGVMWYDQRNDPINNRLHDVYLTTSNDGGRSFTANRRITDGNWLLAPGSLSFRPGYHGDYIQMVATDNGFALCWNDDRNGTDSDVYTKVLTTAEAAASNRDFNLFSLPGAANVLAGGEATFDLKVDAFSNAYALSSSAVATASADASGLNFSFTTTPDTLKLKATVANNVAPGTYPIRASVRINGSEHFTTLRLNVSSPLELVQAPQALTSPRESHYQPRAVTDANNDLHIVTGLDPAGQSFTEFGMLSYTRVRNGAVVQSTPIVTFNDPDELAFLNARIGVDSTGNNITITWLASNLPVDDVLLSRSTDGGKTFSAPRLVVKNTNPSLVYFAHDVAIGRDGSINLAIDQVNFQTGAENVYFTRSRDGGATFSPLVNVSAKAPTAAGFDPALTIEASGAVDIAYTGISTANRGDVYFSRSTDGITFTTPLNVSNLQATTSAAVNGFVPTIAADGANVYVAFGRRQLARNEQEVYFARSTNSGASFSTAVNISRGADAGNQSFAPHLGVDRKGNVGISFYALTTGPLYPGQIDAMFASSTDGGRTFLPAINVSNNFGTQSMFPITVLDANGNLATLWSDESSGVSQVMLGQAKGVIF